MAGPCILKTVQSIMMRARFTCLTLVLATLLVVDPRAAVDQQTVRLTVKVVLVDAAGAATPVPHHALLVSDNPPSAAPRRIITAPDGTAGLNVRPGSYVVESDQPVAFAGQTYRWIQTVDVAGGGRDGVLELNAGNAIAGPVTTAMATEKETPADADPSALLLRWQDSVVALWTPTAHASGFVIDQRGLIATSHRVIGEASSVEVQFTPTTKVAGSVLATDPARDVAIVRVNPAALASMSSAPPDCASPAALPGAGDDLLTIGMSLSGTRDVSFGMVRRATPSSIVADLNLRTTSPGGPVFAADGVVVGITSVEGGSDERLRGDSPVVSLDDVCAGVRSVETTMRDAAPPDATPLPVEPSKALPVDVLVDEIAHRVGDLAPYAMSSSDFDIRFITPVLAYHGLHHGNPPDMDFSNWSDYVRSAPPVLLVRVTPKQSESFWMKLVRGAAWTQGASLPPITHFKPGFARLRAFCGEAEVTPVHPFTLELRLSETEAIHEGLFVFAPDALGPHCGSVRLVLYSAKEPDKGDTREVEAGVLRRIWQDFAPYRAMSSVARLDMVQHGP
jgi:S1-C subfamily serine protease